ncbi:hypothetical protein [Actinoplanes subglobosus]|uniref:Uncharacterized protein n=1 Tax=Actinoplanes subglobosus TaxID=1547892 RepID=A0ABV8IXP7_9ACTN
MSVTEWPRAEPALERFYRRLLHAYPRAYRHRYGTEIVTTLLEMAEPGQRHPKPADAWHLLASGLRQRLRLPAGRPLTRIAAILALLAGGALGAAAGSWAAVQTFAGLPAPAQADALHRQVTGTTAADTNPMYTDAAGVPLWWSISSTDRIWDGEQARARLTADGWQTGPLTATDRFATSSQAPEHGFAATRDGLTLTVTGEGAAVVTDLAPHDPGQLLPMIAAGLTLGALTGWLTAAAVARRRSRPATAAAIPAFAVLFAPVWSLYDQTVAAWQTAGRPGIGVQAVHGILAPSGHQQAGPAWLAPLWAGTSGINAALTGAGLLLAATAVVLSLRFPHRPTPPRQVTA